MPSERYRECAARPMSGRMRGPRRTPPAYDRGVAYEEGVLQALQRVTDAALAHLSEDDLLTELLRRISEILDSDTAAILLLDDARNELYARGAKGIEEEVEQGVRIPVGAGFAGRVAEQQ